jgi:hypothetical protein
VKYFGLLILSAGLIGFGLGLTYAWAISPVRYLDTAPAALRGEFKNQFRVALASAYSASGNLERAKARLALLGEADDVAALGAQAQRVLAAGDSFQQAQELAQLASDLQAGISSIPQPTAASPADTPPLSASAAYTVSPNATAPTGTSPAAPAPPVMPTPTIQTPTSRSTRTPVRTPSAPFQLVSRDEVCDPDVAHGLLQVTVLDSGGQPMPAIEVTIVWAQGEERFFTGLKPEIGDGYADYVMQDDTTYSLLVARSGSPVSNIEAPLCPGTGGFNYLGGLTLTFKEP